MPRALWKSLPIALVGLLLGGCPDPNPMAGVQGPGGGPPGGEGGQGAPPAAPADPGATNPNDARWKVSAAEGVKLAGTFEYAGSSSGQLRMDFMAVSDDMPPRLVHTLELKSKGEWKAVAPKGAGRIYILSFIDQDANGPSPTDPAGGIEVTVADAALEGLVIQLSDNPSPEIFRPGGQPRAPEESGGPPAAAETSGSPGGAPAEGAPAAAASPPAGDPAAAPAPPAAPR